MIFFAQGKFNCQSRNHYGKCCGHGGHVNLKKHQKHGKKISTNNRSLCTLEREADILHEAGLKQDKKKRLFIPFLFGS